MLGLLGTIDSYDHADDWTFFGSLCCMIGS